MTTGSRRQLQLDPEARWTAYDQHLDDPAWTDLFGQLGCEAAARAVREVCENALIHGGCASAAEIGIVEDGHLELRVGGARFDPTTHASPNLRTTTLLIERAGLCWTWCWDEIQAWNVITIRRA